MVQTTEEVRHLFRTLSGQGPLFLAPKLQSHLMKSSPTRPTRSPEHICPLNLRCLNKPSPHWIFRLQLVHQLLRDRDTITTLHGDLPTGTSLFCHDGIHHYQKLSCLFVTYISLPPPQLLCQQNALSIANNRQMWVEGQIRGWISICVRNVFLSETPCRHVLVTVQ